MSCRRNAPLCPAHRLITLRSSALRANALSLPTVIAGLDPAIHEVRPHAQTYGWASRMLIMDARVEPAHDVEDNDARIINLVGTALSAFAYSTECSLSEDQTTRHGRRRFPRSASPRTEYFLQEAEQGDCSGDEEACRARAQTAARADQKLVRCDKDYWRA